jgi:Ca2+-binding EF-hand superfamily protein
MDLDKDLEIFKIVFEVFDPERTGFVTKDDVVAITVSMRKDLNLVLQVLDNV